MTALDTFIQGKMYMALHFLELLRNKKTKVLQKVNLQENIVCLEQQFLPKQ